MTRTLHSHQSLHCVLNRTVKMMHWALSQAERSLAYISVLDINHGLSWLITSQLGEQCYYCNLQLQWQEHYSMWLSPECLPCTPWWGQKPMYLKTYTQVLKTVCTLHALDPLVVLFQSALAMYSFLNLMKLVVASLYRQPRILYVVRHFHRTHALVSVFQQSSDY